MAEKQTEKKENVIRAYNLMQAESVKGVFNKENAVCIGLKKVYESDADAFNQFTEKTGMFYELNEDEDAKIASAYKAKKAKK